MRSRLLFAMSSLLLISAAPAGWVYEEKADPLSDVRTATASVETPEGGIAFTCQDGRKDSFGVIALSRRYLGSSEGGGRPVTFRLDKDEAVTVAWRYSDRAAAKFGPATLTLARAVLSSDAFVLRLYTYRNEEVTLVPNVAVHRDNLQRLLDHCIN